jgi:hypothetical protein
VPRISTPDPILDSLQILFWQGVPIVEFISICSGHDNKDVTISRSPMTFLEVLPKSDTFKPRLRRKAMSSWRSISYGTSSYFKESAEFRWNELQDNYLLKGYMYARRDAKPSTETMSG